MLVLSPYTSLKKLPTGAVTDFQVIITGARTVAK